MLTLLLLLATPRGAFALYPPSVHHASCTNASSLLLILDTFSVPRISVDVILFCLSNHIKTLLPPIFFIFLKLKRSGHLENLKNIFIFFLDSSSNCTAEY